MSVKDDVIDENGDDKENDDDYGPDPWVGVPAPDPWTPPVAHGHQQDIPIGRPLFSYLCQFSKSVSLGPHNYRPVHAAEAGNGSDEKPSSSTKPLKTELNFGVIGGLFADYFASQEHRKNPPPLCAGKAG